MMTTPTASVFDLIEHNARVPTWFGVGGGADALVRPNSEEELRDVLVAFAHERVRVLGEGANLLVHDDGADGIVVSLERMNGWETLDDGDAPGIETESDWTGETVLLRADAGAKLPRLIVQTVRDGLAGLEGLAGVPATVGGAVRMNAGGAFGEIGAAVHEVRALTHMGTEMAIPASELAFGYRTSGVEHAIVTSVTLRLVRVPEGDRATLRDRLKEVMAYKKVSQPMSEKSAGCVFRNPLVSGGRVSAGLLIDEARCKGLRVGGASVSARHANFIVTDQSSSAAHVIELMDRVRESVKREWGVTLENEVVIWKRDTVA